MLRILVDGDGCPVKEEVYGVAHRCGVPVVLVANAPLAVPRGLPVELVMVEQGPDAADDWIVEHVNADDVVVTADIPLAARCLDKRAQVLGTTGRAFTEASIGGQLAMRDLKTQLREMGTMTGGPPGITQKDRSRFLSKLDEMVQRGLREARA